MDASDFVVGGYLFQRDEQGGERIIAYGGGQLTPAELIYPTREKELLAALHVMRMWKVYLIDRPFYINTDHHIIASILQQQTCSQRLARWLNELALFQPMFKWIEGSTNVVADMISRKPVLNDGTARAISLSALLESLISPELAAEPNSLFAMRRSTQPSILDECRRLGPSDSFLGPILTRLSEAQPEISSELRHFSVDNGLVYFQPFAESPRRLCIPADTALRNKLLLEEHDVATRGDPGYHKTHIFMASKYYWPNLVKSVRKYVASCESCQRSKNPRGKSPGLIRPLDIPSARWQDISMDFMVNLPPTSSGHDAIMVIVDRLTKRSHFLTTSTRATAMDTAQLFCASYQRLHGLPRSIVSDRDAKFTSKLWEGIMRLQRSELHLSTAFRLSTDGQSEATNKFLVEYLRHFLEPFQTDWEAYLPLGEFAYNSREHSTTGLAPFVAALGHLPRSVSDLVLKSHHGGVSAGYALRRPPAGDIDRYPGRHGRGPTIVASVLRSESSNYKFRRRR